MSKTALIVDDSKSARIVLKRMLETHNLNVDTAESAEDALDYLSDNRPDVIFMDHLMPGMDGFEAVSAIKNNPQTATIPIMMYTSQEGEVYVGQARALGAVGVLPKQVEPVEVSKVLESLRVIGADREAQQKAIQEGSSTATSGEYPGLETLDQDLRILIKDLFEQQRAVLRRDLLDSYETIASRVVDEIRPAETVQDDFDPDDEDDVGLSRMLRIAIPVLVVISLVFAWLYWQREQAWQQLQSQYSLLQQEVDNQRNSGAENSLYAMQQIEEYQQSTSTLFAAAISGLEWGANQAAQYAYDELPLGDNRLTIIEQLTEQLTAINYSGMVRIETHVADFCLSDAGAGDYELASGNRPAITCDRIGLPPGEAYELGLRQSVAFANYLRLARAQSGGKIQYEVVSLGNSDPIMEYPAAPGSVSVSTWNGIAARNNRVEITLYPDNF